MLTISSAPPSAPTAPKKKSSLNLLLDFRIPVQPSSQPYWTTLQSIKSLHVLKRSWPLIHFPLGARVISPLEMFPTKILLLKRAKLILINHAFLIKRIFLTKRTSKTRIGNKIRSPPKPIMLREMKKTMTAIPKMNLSTIWWRSSHQLLEMSSKLRWMKSWPLKLTSNRPNITCGQLGEYPSPSKNHYLNQPHVNKFVKHSSQKGSSHRQPQINPWLSLLMTFHLLLTFLVLLLHFLSLSSRPLSRHSPLLLRFPNLANIVAVPKNRLYQNQPYNIFMVIRSTSAISWRCYAVTMNFSKRF